MLPAKFSLIWPSSFRENLFYSGQSETRIALGSHVCWPNGTKQRNFIEDLTQMLSAKIGSMQFQRRRFFQQQPIRNKNCSWQLYLLAKRNETKKFIEDVTQMLPAKFGSIWPRSFRGEDLFNISQSETRIALGSHICWQKGMKRRNFIEDLTQMLPAKVGSIWPSSFSGEDVLTVTNQKKELLLAAMFICRLEPNEEVLQKILHRCFLPSLV